MTNNTPPSPSLEAGNDDGNSLEPGGMGEAGKPLPSTRVLKAVVVVLGVLLVAGFGLVVTTIAYRLFSGSDVSSAAPARESWGRTPIPLPPGGVAGVMVLDGDRLAVRVETPDGADIIIMDIKRGHEIGRFRMTLPETP